MTPHRIAEAKWVMTIAPDAMGAGAVSLAALFGWFTGNFNSTLFTLVLFAMVIDIIVGGLRAVVDPLDEFDRRKILAGLVKKAFWLLIIPTASVVDALYAISPFPLREVVAHNFPITVAVMYALAAAEISSTLDHFRNGGVAPGAIAIVMRHLDRLKVGGDPPQRRHYDLAAKIEEEEIENESHRERPERPKRTGS